MTPEQFYDIFETERPKDGKKLEAVKKAKGDQLAHL